MTSIVPEPIPAISAELRVQRKNTLRYIQANPSEVLLQRAARVRDGAGGWRSSRAPLPETQTVRIIQADENSGVERRNSDGEVVRPILNMLCMFDADVEVGDQFTWDADGSLCEVVYITDLKYELTCEVSVR